MAFRQERMIAVLDDFAALRLHFNALREFLEMARGQVTDELAKSYLAHALAEYKLLPSEAFSAEERHFKRHRARNIREAERRREGRGGLHGQPTLTTRPTGTDFSTATVLQRLGHEEEFMLTAEQEEEMLEQKRRFEEEKGTL